MKKYDVKKVMYKLQPKNQATLASTTLKKIELTKKTIDILFLLRLSFVGFLQLNFLFDFTLHNCIL